MLACDTCEAWTQFIHYVKGRTSATAFGNWLAPIHVIESGADAITLEVPNVFVQEYLLSNYKKDLCAFLPVNADGEPAIKFIIKPQQPKTKFLQPLPKKRNTSRLRAPTKSS